VRSQNRAVKGEKCARDPGHIGFKYRFNAYLMLIFICETLDYLDY